MTGLPNNQIKGIAKAICPGKSRKITKHTTM